jgi:diguanylate cyclase (GGDEF)-like protein
VNQLGPSATAIVAAPTVLDLREALTDAVGDLVPGDARWRLSLLASDDLPRLVTVMAEGRLVEPRHLPAAVSEELGGLPYVFACPLRCRDRTGAEVLRGVLFVGAPTVELLAELEPPLRTLAALAGAALDRLALAAEVDRADLDGFFRTLVMRASDVVLIVEPDDFRIRFASPSATRVFPTAHLVGAELPTLLSPGNPADARRQLDGLCTDQAHTEPGAERPTADWTIVRPNGSPVQIAVRCLDLRVDPAVSGVVVSMRDVTDQRRMEAELTFQAFYDDLTGLPNRALFRDRLGQAVARAGRSGGIVGVLFIDLDDFKIVNDTMGHDSGDALLRLVAERLVGGLRPGDTAARLGGDEFAVVIEEIRTAAAVEDVAQRVVTLMGEPFGLHGRTVPGRASVGVATTLDATDDRELLRQADLALYAAKSDGKGQWRRHDPERWKAVLERLELRSALDEGVRNHEFSLVYQPIVALADRRPVGMEALVRWNHPERGILLPDRFIDVAEESDTILALGGWIAREAIRTAAEWHRRLGRSAPYMSINVSARQFRAPDFARGIQDALADSALPGDHLMIELTETLLLHDGPKVMADLISLHLDGIKVAVDDFGTGYSALGYLREVPLDVLKLDQGFTARLRSGDQDGSLVEGIIKLAHTIGVQVIAEGIEGPDQFRLLVHSGCEYGQGFEISRPMDPDQAFQWMIAAGEPPVMAE